MTHTELKQKIAYALDRTNGHTLILGIIAELLMDVIDCLNGKPNAVQVQELEQSEPKAEIPQELQKRRGRKPKPEQSP